MNMPIINFTSLRLWRRAFAVVLAVVVACGCAVAKEKSFRIRFTRVEPEQTVATIYGPIVNNNLTAYIAEGSEYVSSFTNFTNITRDKVVNG